MGAFALAADLWEARAASRSPATIAAHIDPDTVETPALALITDRLVDTSRKRGGRLIISMPPQEGKTTRASRDFPVWMLANNPDLRVVLASYNADRAGDLGRTLRNTIAENPALGLSLSGDSKAADTFHLSSSKGGVRARGVGGALTGFASDIMIIDDPHKDLAAASSAAEQKAVWDWWTGSVLTRITPSTPIVIIATRWHEKDLIGQILSSPSGPEWEVVNLPAEAESVDDPLGRKPGEWLTSTRGRTPEDWERTKRAVGSRVWAALYQGRPAPAEGDTFKRSDWRYYARYPDLTGCRVIQSWDLAFTGNATSDYTVGQVWAHDPARGLFFLLDQVRGRWSFTEAIDQMLLLTAKWPQAVQKLVEAKANGNAAIDLLAQRGITGLTPVTPRDGKTFRAQVVSPLVEAHNVALPGPLLAPWVGAFVEEAAAFPNAANDDQVDAATQALSHLAIPTGQRGWSSGFMNLG